MRIWKAGAVMAATLYPVGKGQPRRSPGTTILSLLGTGYLWYYGALILLAAGALGAAVGLAIGDWIKGAS